MLKVNRGLEGAAVFCLAMAAAATVVALVPRWRKAWGWGRSGNAGPISSIGWTGIVVTFLLIGAGAASADHGLFDPFFSLMLVLGGFALFIAAAVFDSVRNGRSRRKK